VLLRDGLTFGKCVTGNLHTGMSGFWKPTVCAGGSQEAASQRRAK
jgi:hypothetical protein